jgi:hypothetical protein
VRDDRTVAAALDHPAGSQHVRNDDREALAEYWSEIVELPDPALL